MASPAAVLSVLVKANGIATVNKQLGGLHSQGKKTAGQLDNLEQSSKRAHRGLTAAGKAAVGMAGAVGAVALAKGAVNTTEDLAKATLLLSKNFGLSTKTASEWAAVAKARGVDGKQLTMGFKGLSTAIRGASTGGKTQIATFKELGISQRDVAKHGNDLNYMLGAVSDGLAKLGPGTNRSAIQAKLFGRSWQTLSPLLRDGSGALNEQLHSADKLGATFSGKGAKGMEDMIKQQRTAKLATLGLQVAFGTQLAPALTAVIEKVVEIIGWFRQHETIAKALGIAIAALAAGVTVYNVASKVAAVATAGWTAAQWLLNAALDANPIALVAIGIAALVAAIVIAYKHSETFRKIVNGMWAAIKAVAAWLVTAGVAAFNAVANAVKTAWGAIKSASATVGSAVTAAWNTIRSVTTVVWGAIRDFLLAAWSVLSGIAKVEFIVIRTAVQIAWYAIRTVTTAVWGAIRDFLVGLWNHLKAAAAAVFGAIKSVIAATLNGIKNITTTVWNAIRSFLMPLWNVFKAGATVVFGAIRSVITNDWNLIKAVTSTVWGAIHKATVGVWNGLKSVATTVWNAIKGVILTPIRAARDALRGVWAQMRDAAHDAWEKIKTGAKDFAGSLKDTITNAFEGAVNSVIDFVNKIIDVVNKIPGVTNIKHIGRIGGGGGGHGSPGGPRGTGRLAKGGMVPGTGSGDKVPLHLGGRLAAMVEPGELVSVANRNATAALMGVNGAVPRFAGGGILNTQEMADLWRSKGGSASLADTMGVIGLVESGGNPRAHNPSGASGLWQILGQLVPGNLFNPGVNALNAIAKYKAQGLHAWDASRSKWGPLLGKKVGPDLDPLKLIGSLPGVGGLPDWLKGTGKYVLSHVGDWIKDNVAKLIPGGGKPGGGGLGTFDGKPVANWIIPILNWARRHGWGGHITSGYRSHAHNVAQGRTYHSNHEDTAYPGGAIDVGGYGARAEGQSLASVLAGYHGGRRLVWGGPTMGDWGHFSATGHKTGGVIAPFVGSYADGGVIPRTGMAMVHAGETVVPAFKKGGKLNKRQAAAKKERLRVAKIPKRAWDANLLGWVDVLKNMLTVAKLTKSTDDDLYALRGLAGLYQRGLRGAKKRGDLAGMASYADNLTGVRGDIAAITAPADSGAGGDPNQPLIDALAAQTAAEQAHTQALNEVGTQMKRQTDLAEQINSTSFYQQTKFLADIMSGQFGRGIVGRSYGPGTGVEVAY